MAARLPDIRTPPAADEPHVMGVSNVKSLLEAPTPRPPSPYKPGKVALRARKSVLPALFEFKLDRPRRRDKKLLLLRDAERRMEEKYLKSIPVGFTSKLSREGRGLREAAAAPAIEDAPSQQPPVESAPVTNSEVEFEAESSETATMTEGEDAQFSSADVAMREFFFMEAQQEQVCQEEESERNLVLSEEEYGYTTILVDFLQFLPEVIAIDDPELVAETKKDELARAQEREAFFNQIAERISTRFRAEKLRDKLLALSGELLTQHAAALEELKAKEDVEWSELMEWSNKRLQRYGQAMEKEDYRLRSLKRRKIVNGRPVENIGEGYLRRLRDSKKEGQLVVCDDPYTAAHEALFALVGRQEYASEKEIKAALEKLEKACETLEEEEIVTREKEQRLESEAWIPLMFYGIDGYYEARRATRDREELEELERRKEAGDELAKAEIKRRLLAKAFTEKAKDQASSTQWTPDVVA